ncbi:GatB/YqeY domain-containing protein [Lichenihabitans sp. PAMC28606]|uniref:GatB/YqeY domain-containing protein n=1 Tax=Lichenihabitans sp. PAMC28606 TaxID=2880932 RepID=UPI001D0AD828|nr:GatB/YqeY domain-containing protein [Lichenihabitans sp. PAMC28606]UDL94227.1 GatB/YqeY domain-containing protein [Lichenihabitans sp. PAMC28606]
MRDQLSTMLKVAMKAGDKPRVGTIRLIQSALKDKDIELRPSGKTVGEEDISAVLRKMVKQRQDSIAIYDQAGRDDLASQEREELAIIGEFLPKEMEEAEVRTAIADAIEQSGAAGPRDMGKVIAAMKAKYAGQIDFGKASALVKSMLNDRQA